MNNKLFDGFDSVSSKQWKQKIQYELKGADYNNTLIHKTDENIAIKPFYHSDDFKTHPSISNTRATQWKICQSIFVADVKKSNKKAINAIERGAESITFIIPSDDVSVSGLLRNINLNKTLVYLELLFLPSKFIKNLDVIPNAKTIHILNDIIGNLAKSGNWHKNIQNDFKTFQSTVKHTSQIYVDAGLYQNAGANMVQQLAYALAHANEYLNYLENEKAIPTTIKLIFNISVGSNYFFEIAKLRVLRKLWSSLSSEYSIETHCDIIATPTKRNKTIYAYNTNMLRTTTECMSAVLGGANVICNLPYDSIYHKSNKFGERIARNQLSILKNESYFDKVDNPSDGSYYIETLTDELCEKALNLFKDIEAQGGFLKQLKSGIIQRKIKENANKEQQRFDAEKDILVGTNKYINPNDCIKNELELYPFIKTNQRKTLIEPIIERRLAESIEQNRLKSE